MPIVALSECLKYISMYQPTIMNFFSGQFTFSTEPLDCSRMDIQELGNFSNVQVVIQNGHSGPFLRKSSVSAILLLWHD